MKKYSFTDDEVDALYELVYIANDVSEDRKEKTFYQQILKKIDEQADYTRPEVQEYAIHIPNTEYTDYVYGKDSDDALLNWCDHCMQLEVVELK